MRISRYLFPLLLATSALTLTPNLAAAQVSVGVSITVAPPVLPVYVQPPIPAPGYIWTPGYWAYGDAGYYWVPGTWVLPPTVGLLWTPGYWGWSDGVYAFNAGYWGPTSASMAASITASATAASATGAAAGTTASSPTTAP